MNSPIVIASIIGAVPHVFRTLFLSTVFLLPGWQAQAADTNGVAIIVGTGNRSCSAWITDAKAGSSQFNASHVQEIGWVTGYLSAYNALVWEGKNVTSETDLREILAWMNGYCSANPTQKIGGATKELIKILASGSHPNDN